MRSTGIGLGLCAFLGVAVGLWAEDKAAPSGVLSFKATDIDGKEVELKTLSGKVLLIVNVASL